MRSSHSQITTAIILHKVSFSEADEIVNLLTMERGVLRLFAKARKKSKKRFSGGLEVFSQAQIVFHPSFEGRLGKLLESELVTEMPAVWRTPEGLALASFLAEMILGFMPEGADSCSVYELWQSWSAFFSSKSLRSQDVCRCIADFLTAFGFGIGNGQAYSLTELIQFTEDKLEKKLFSAGFLCGQIGEVFPTGFRT